MKFTDFLSDVGRPMAYYPSLARALGCVKAGIFLANLIYWKGKEEDPNGWIYKSSNEIKLETGLPYDQQLTARRRLKRLGLIEERYARLNHRLYFRPHIDAINIAWERWRTKSEKSVNSCATPYVPQQEVDASIPWPNDLTSGQLAACRRKLRRLPEKMRPELVTELASRMARKDLQRMESPDLYLDALVTRALSGDYEPRYSTQKLQHLTDAERAEIEAEYQRKLRESREQGDRTRAGLLAHRGGNLS